jgi:hypothetical protein
MCHKPVGLRQCVRRGYARKRIVFPSHHCRCNGHLSRGLGCSYAPTLASCRGLEAGLEVKNHLVADTPYGSDVFCFYAHLLP